jgi:hypothetical protein
MRMLLRPAVAYLWLTLSVMPASAQLDRIGGAVEFRAPDRPISPPPLGGLDESKSSDVSKLVSPGVPTDVIKHIDQELGRTPTPSTMEVEVGRRDSTAKVGDRPHQRGLEGSTFR